MRSLILKDFTLLQSSRLYLMGLLYTLFIVFDRGNANSLFETSTFFLVFITYIFVNYLNSYDYTYKGDRFVNAFPVSRKEVVESRYMSVIILVGGFFSLAYGLRSILYILGYPYAKGIVDLMQLSVVILAVGFYYGIMLPLYFKFGFERLRWINFLSFIVVSVLASVLGVILGELPTVSGIWALLLSVGGATSVLGLSVTLAVKVYEGRDF